MQLLLQNLNIHLKCQAQEQLQGTSDQSVILWVGSQGCGAEGEQCGGGYGVGVMPELGSNAGSTTY